ncbi:MAG: hypothetical protein FJ299_09935 [Planctomycetes bacterium]|nr:hypothetical protein [Planctomycetota bacterium]
MAKPDPLDAAQAPDSVRHVRSKQPKLEEGIGRLRAIAANDPQAASKIALAGSATARAQAILAGVGVRAAMGPLAGAGVTNCYWDPPYYGYNPGSYWYPWGLGFNWYSKDFCFNFGFGGSKWGWYWPLGGYACYGPSLSFCWNYSWNSCLYWSSYYAYKPWHYYGGPAVAYSTCYVPYYAPSYVSYVPTYYPVVVDSEPAAATYYEEAAPSAVVANEIPAGEVSASIPARANQAPEPLNDPIPSAATRFLELGDAAFRSARYSDAVQHYARAVENAPDEGVLYLVLADALFATRDYHYAAYALRRAFALEPSLASGAIDKRGFYTDPIEFDQQLAALELFVKEHPLDADARLVLAANYVFGGRPQAAVALLQAPAASSLRGESAAALLLAAAEAAQHGMPATAQTPAASPLPFAK